jgi:hypothetical protein
MELGFDQVIRAGCQANARLTLSVLGMSPIRQSIHESGHFVMPNWALSAVRLLRKLPHTVAFDRHLDDCAILDIDHQIFGESHALTLAHVFLRKPLPETGVRFLDRGSEGVERSMLSEDGRRNHMKPVLIYAADGIQRKA